MHPAASRRSALLMIRTLPYNADYQQLLCVCVLLLQTVGIQLVFVFKVSVLTSCICTDCYRSTIMDFRLQRGDSWCLFVSAWGGLTDAVISRLILSTAVSEAEKWDVKKGSFSFGGSVTRLKGNFYVLQESATNFNLSAVLFAVMSEHKCSPTSLRCLPMLMLEVL